MQIMRKILSLMWSLFTHHYQREKEALSHPGHQQTTWCRWRGFWAISSWSLLNSKAGHTSESTSPHSHQANSLVFNLLLSTVQWWEWAALSPGRRQFSLKPRMKRRDWIHVTDRFPRQGLVVIHTSIDWRIICKRPFNNVVDFCMSPMKRD